METFRLIAMRDQEMKELETFLDRVNVEVAARQARIKLLNEQIQQDEMEMQDESLGS